MARNRIGCSISKRDCRARRSSSSPVGGRRAAHSSKASGSCNLKPASIQRCVPPAIHKPCITSLVEGRSSACGIGITLLAGSERVAPPQTRRVRSLRTASFFWRRFPVRGGCFLTPQRGHLTEICEMGVTISVSDPGSSVSTPNLRSTRPGYRDDPPGQSRAVSKGQRQQDDGDDCKMQRAGSRTSAFTRSQNKAIRLVVCKTRPVGVTRKSNNGSCAPGHGLAARKRLLLAPAESEERSLQLFLG